MLNDTDMPESRKLLRVAVIDDYPVVRRGMISFLNDAGYQAAAVWEFDPATAADQVDHHDWDLVLLGAPLEQAGWLLLIKHLAQGHPATHVLVLSELEDQKHEIAALRAGASGYLHKSSPPGTISMAIRKVVEGGNFVSQNLVHALVDQLNHHRVQKSEDTLSDREYQVLRGLVSGKSTKEIASDLHLSSKTVSTYRARLCAKLNVQSNAALIRYALKHKIAC